MKYSLLILLIVFTSCKKNIDNNVTAEINNSTKDLMELFQTKVSNDTLEQESMINVDIINGFRSVKLGLKLDSINYEGWIVDNELSRYGIVKLLSPRTNPSKHYLDIFGDVYIRLTFYRGELHLIGFHIVNHNNEVQNPDIYDLLEITYGKPNYVDGKPIDYDDLKKEKDNAIVYAPELDPNHKEYYKSFDKIFEKEWVSKKNSIVYQRITRKHLLDDLGWKLWNEHDLVFTTNELEKIELDISILKESANNEILKQERRNKMNEL